MPGGEHAPQNVMRDGGEIAAFHDRCSALMRELLEALAAAPDSPRSFPEVEDAMGWPRRRIASVLGGVFRLRTIEFGGRRPYRLDDGRASGPGRWEIWMDAEQARATRRAASEHRAQEQHEERDREDRGADHEQPSERRRLRPERVPEPPEHRV